METHPIDVYGLGQCALDHLGLVERYPEADSKCEMTGLVIQGGGPVATALVALSRWGMRCAFAGVVGDDTFGKLIREGLEQEQIDTRDLITRPGAVSQVAFIASEAGPGRRTIFWQRPTGGPIAPGEVNQTGISRSRLFLTDGLFIEAALEGARAARLAGVPVVVDGGTLRDGMLELAELSDCYVVSETFAGSLTGGSDAPEEACRKLAALGPAMAGVTLGQRGYVALHRGRWIRGDAYPADTVDTTGCGDVFHAGLAFGMAKGWDPEATLDFASWAASRVATALGGRQGIPDAGDWPSR